MIAVVLIAVIGTAFTIYLADIQRRGDMIILALICWPVALFCLYPSRWLLVLLIGFFFSIFLVWVCHQSALEGEHHAYHENHSQDGRLVQEWADVLQQEKDHQLYEQLFGKEAGK